MRRAPMMAMASSMNAAGRFSPKKTASRERKAAPPNVPMTAPTAPAAAPAARLAPVAAMAAPASAPVTMRAPSCIGTLRLGVLASWSVISSASASAVNSHGAHHEPMKASGVLARENRPAYPAQLTTAGAVIARKPATIPMRRARMTSMACAPVQFAAMDWRPNAVALQHLALARSWQTPQVASGRRQFHCYPGAGDPKGVHDEKRAIGCRNDEPQGGRRSGEERHGRRPPRRYR